MGMRGIVEFALHVHKFANIDLLQQGIYQIRFKLHYEDTTYKYYATPHLIHVNQHKKAKPSPYMLTQPFYKEPTSEYLTKLFLIRYCEEEVTC